MLFFNGNSNIMSETNSVKYYADYKEASKKYNEYIETHVNNVIRSFDDILNPQLHKPENWKKFNLSDDIMENIRYCILRHDDSKTGPEEFAPYMKNFYPTCDEDLNEENKKLYDLAWLHHQHENPHHYQYWVLNEDSGNIKILDMDFGSICEMICDWHSFSFVNPESTCYNWYKKNKDKMLLSDKTRETVEELLLLFR